MARSAAVGTTVDGASRRAWNPATGYAVVLLLPCLFLLVFFVWPMVTVVARSFAEQSVWFEHYATVLERSSYLTVLLYTLQVATSVTILCLLIAYPVSAVVGGFAVSHTGLNPPTSAGAVPSSWPEPPTPFVSLWQYSHMCCCSVSLYGVV